MIHSTRHHDGQLADALIDVYVEWREECRAVRLAYQGLRTASEDDRSATFAAFRAALDREERAADVYAALVQQASATKQPA